MSATTLRRTTPADIALARQMHDGDWTPKQIHHYLAARGVDVSSRTVHRWVSPDIYDRELERNRARRARKVATSEATFRLSSNTPEYRMAFLRLLASERVSASASGRVFGIVFGQRLSEHQVRYALKAGRLPDGLGRTSGSGPSRGERAPDNVDRDARRTA